MTKDTILITKRQIKKLLSEFSKMYKLQQKMSVCTNKEKTFALAGRIVGDIGECLASYLFDIALEKKQEEGHDGWYRKTPVEVKVRTTSDTNSLNYIRISKPTFKQDFYLIFFVFDMENKEIIVKTNTLVSGKVLKAIKKIIEEEQGKITFNKLKSCLNDNPYAKCIKSDNSKLGKISGWKICNKVK